MICDGHKTPLILEYLAMATSWFYYLRIDCPKSGPGPGGPRSGPDPKCLGPGPAGEWTGPGPNLVVNSLKKSLQNKPKNIFFGQLLTKIWTKQ